MLLNPPDDTPLPDSHRHEQGRRHRLGGSALHTQAWADRQREDDVPDDRFAREALVRPEPVTARLLVHACNGHRHSAAGLRGREQRRRDGVCAPLRRPRRLLFYDLGETHS